MIMMDSIFCPKVIFSINTDFISIKMALMKQEDTIIIKLGNMLLLKMKKAKMMTTNIYNLTNIMMSYVDLMMMIEKTKEMMKMKKMMRIFIINLKLQKMMPIKAFAKSIVFQSLSG